ncbi:uncharacterized protein K444DRAFT_72369 [Hyaloscypha bicolor E]|uniref:Secreted protein n=1 Tax=Hyaloscypha bicolor E TaxID=1095630 RepID=A0A2J6SZ28_9HELO|nr:uncharacterized protein K444DRAFT_72369 [Hyaloscypha bicolor E]PMD56027.1 hypothetical protein K444DRAFT_72369 [Hyaloscypha bicolor E]
MRGSCLLFQLGFIGVILSDASPDFPSNLIAFSVWRVSCSYFSHVKFYKFTAVLSNSATLFLSRMGCITFFHMIILERIVALTSIGRHSASTPLKMTSCRNIS